MTRTSSPLHFHLSHILHCAIAAVICFILAAVGVLMMLAGEITWRTPLGLAGAGILLGATSYGISETL